MVLQFGNQLKIDMGIGRKLRRGTIRPVVDENGKVLYFIDKKGRRIDPLKLI